MLAAAAAAAALQVLEKLKQPDMHWHLLPIVEAALPLVTAPFTGLSASAQQRNPSSGSGNGAEEQPPEADAGLREQCRGMLGALSRALTSTAAVAAADRAAALAGCLSGRPAEGAAAARMLPVALSSPAPGAIVSGGDADGGVCCWDLGSLNLLLLCLR